MLRQLVRSSYYHKGDTYMANDILNIVLDLNNDFKLDYKLSIDSIEGMRCLELLIFDRCAGDIIPVAHSISISTDCIIHIDIDRYEIKNNIDISSRWDKYAYKVIAKNGSDNTIVLLEGILICV